MLSNLTQKCMLRYRPANDQTISARFHIKTHLIIIKQVFTSTVEAEEDVINSFYTDLQNKVSREHKNDILIAMGGILRRNGL